MSNLSLKEQLEALSLAPEKKQEKFGKKQNKKNKPDNKNKPQWLEHAQYGVELLKTYFPQCFRDIKDIKPLKKGIKQDLVKELSTLENIVLGDKACMVSSLSYYVNSIAYHKSVVEGAERIDLEGKPAGIVTAEEANYSAESRKAKVEKRKGVQNNKKTEPDIVK